MPSVPVAPASDPVSVSLVGSTGSIGTQAVEVIESCPGAFEVVALGAQSSVDALVAQAGRLHPRVVAVGDAGLAGDLERRLPPGTEVLVGTEGLRAIATLAEVVVNGVVGFAGLPVTLAALEAGRRLALANKESLIAGAPVVQVARRTPGAEIVPVDSEHCALHQCLRSGAPEEVRRLVLTASGGPFRGRSAAELATVDVADALAHPTWVMGPKITVDSSTLMNKGLEVIEAHELFEVPYEAIDVVVHPQSVIHSMVEFADGAVMAQLSLPDMRLPIGYALSYPSRLAVPFGSIDWTRIGPLEFEAPDRASFPCLDLAFEAGRAGDLAPAWLERGQRGGRRRVPRRSSAVDRHRRSRADRTRRLRAPRRRGSRPHRRGRARGGRRRSPRGGTGRRHPRSRRMSEPGTPTGAPGVEPPAPDPGARSGGPQVDPPAPSPWTRSPRRSAAELLATIALIVAVSIATGHLDLFVVIASIIVIVMLHELGHFVAAKRSGMKVTEYFVGFGPRIWSFRRGETEYGVKAFPLGGYVKIPGMTNLEEVDPADEERTYRQKPFGARMAVALAGSAVHFLVALVLLWCLLTFVGSPNANQVELQGIGQVGGRPGPAQLAGVRPGDIVVSVDGKIVGGDSVGADRCHPRPPGYAGHPRRRPQRSTADARGDPGKRPRRPRGGRRPPEGVGTLRGHRREHRRAAPADQPPACVGIRTGQPVEPHLGLRRSGSPTSSHRARSRSASTRSRAPAPRARPPPTAPGRSHSSASSTPRRRPPRRGSGSSSPS